jgi:hypothetical protein
MHTIKYIRNFVKLLFQLCFYKISGNWPWNPSKGVDLREVDGEAPLSMPKCQATLKQGPSRNCNFLGELAMLCEDLQK